MPDESVEKHLGKFRQLKQAYTDTFSKDSGITVFKDLARKCFEHKTTFSNDALEMARNEGMRSVLLHIENMQKIDIEATKQMLEKQKLEERNA